MSSIPSTYLTSYIPGHRKPGHCDVCLATDERLKEHLVLWCSSDADRNFEILLCSVCSERGVKPCTHGVNSSEAVKNALRN
jgi:hypothetical protein